MNSGNDTGGGGIGGPLTPAGGPPAPKPDTGLPNAHLAMGNEPMAANNNNTKKDTDMTNHPTGSLDQEPVQNMLSSPIFPSYIGYNEAAPGRNLGGGHMQPNAGLVKGQGQGPFNLMSLPMRPAPVKNVPALKTGHQQMHRGDGSGGGTGTIEWASSESGRSFMAQRNLALAPTQLLSLECQKRRFNPAFDVKQEGSRKYTVKVQIQDMTVKRIGHFKNAVVAKQYAAFDALEIVQTWPAPRKGLYFMAQYTGMVSYDLVHDKLRRMLDGRDYTLSTQRWPDKSGGSLLLQIPEDQGYPASFIRLEDSQWSVVFLHVKKGDPCITCARQTNLTSGHACVCCPKWRPSKPEYGSQKHNSIPQRAIKAEQKNEPKYHGNNHGNSGADNTTVNNKDRLIQSIHKEVGAAPTSLDSMAPEVKAAYLQGIALGARLADTAPGNALNKERRPSRSPPRAWPRLDPSWEQPPSRHLSPPSNRRNRSASPFSSPPRNRRPASSFAREDWHRPLIDRGVEPRPRRYGPVDSYRGRRRTPENHGGQGASHWSNDMFLP